MTEKMQIVRPELLDDLTLHCGNHLPGNEGCFMEMFSALTGQRWTDCPRGVEVNVRSVVVMLNDRFNGTPQQRAQILKPFFTEVLNTAPAHTNGWRSPRAQKFREELSMQVMSGTFTDNAAMITQVVKDICALAKQDLFDGLGKESSFPIEGTLGAPYKMSKQAYAMWEFSHLADETPPWKPEPITVDTYIAHGVVHIAKPGDVWKLIAAGAPLNHSLMLAGVQSGEKL